MASYSPIDTRSIPVHEQRRARKRRTDWARVRALAAFPIFLVAFWGGVILAIIAAGRRWP